MQTTPFVSSLFNPELGSGRWVVGVCGGSASGKTHFCAGFAKWLQAQGYAVVRLGGDSYFRDCRHVPRCRRMQLNFDRPQSLDLSLMHQHVRAFKKGRPFRQPVYDFEQHVRKRRHLLMGPFSLGSFMLCEGILIFAHKALQEACNARIFIEADTELRLRRKIERDTTQRGRKPENAVQQFERFVEPGYRKFIAPYKSAAMWSLDGSKPFDYAAVGRRVLNMFARGC